MPVHVVRNGPVTTVILDRPEVRNAVDRAHAQALADAFRAFDGDTDARVAVLWGAGGTFCAGADLKNMEQSMGCAAGACLGCVVTGTDGPQRVCREGPVFGAEEIAWEQMAR